jgi:hypothetical protein
MGGHRWEIKMKNYTSSVPVETTIARIEKILAKFGVVGVAKSYKKGEVDSLCFTVQEPTTGKGITIHLPAKVEAVKKILKEEVRRPRTETYRRIEEQAARTAWKIIQDWVEVQLSLIEMGQAETLQVFLPYVWDGNKTFFEAIKGNGFKMLPQGPKERED